MNICFWIWDTWCFQERDLHVNALEMKATMLFLETIRETLTKKKKSELDK